MKSDLTRIARISESIAKMRIAKTTKNTPKTCQNRGKPLSNNTFLKALQRMTKNITAHGFRSSFRDWAAERTNFPRETCEMALAHSVSDKTEAAYLRGDLFDKRRDLMDTWTSYATAKKGDVVTLRKTSA